MQQVCARPYGHANIQSDQNIMVLTNCMTGSKNMEDFFLLNSVNMKTIDNWKFANKNKAKTI